MSKIVALPLGKKTKLKKNESIVYKVVWRNGDCCHSLYTFEYSLDYKIDIRCKPSLGKIFVYGDRTKLREVIEKRCTKETLVFLVCIGVNPVEIKTIPTRYRGIAIRTFWKFFKTNKSLKVLQSNKLFERKKLSICQMKYVNDGTTLCSSVTPLEIISKENV